MIDFFIKKVSYHLVFGSILTCPFFTYVGTRLGITGAIMELCVVDFNIGGVFNQVKVWNFWKKDRLGAPIAVKQHAIVVAIDRDVGTYTVIRAVRYRNHLINERLNSHFRVK